MQDVSPASKQRVTGDEAEQEHFHPADLHTHDHWHVSHFHSGGPFGEFDHRSHRHSHEHSHGPLVHAHESRSVQDEAEDHEQTAHVHDHEQPSGKGL